MSFPFKFGIGDALQDVSMRRDSATVQKLVPEVTSVDDLVMVSEVLYYTVSYEQYNDLGHVLARYLQDLSERPNSAKVPVDVGKYNQSEFRLAMQTVESINKEEIEAGEAQDTVTLPMKALMFSGNDEGSSRSHREKGFLGKLVCLCGGPDNVTLGLDGMGGDDPSRLPSFGALQGFRWNEEHLRWEADAQVTFRKDTLRYFIWTGLVEERTTLGDLKVNLIQAGVCLWLQRIYGSPGDNWSFQQRLLEEGTTADLVIACGQLETVEENRIKCHRMQLAGASQVFADMLKDTNCWEEGKTGTIKLPESKDTVEAMLHLIYYGGTERIFSCSVDVALELLQAGHKYDIQRLVEVTSFVFQSKLQTEGWFSVDAALELFCFARNVEGHCWTDLRNLSCKVLKKKSKEELTASEEYRKLVHIAEKLGPLFVAVCGGSVDYSEGNYLPIDPVSVSVEETSLIYDFTCSSVQTVQNATFEIAMAARVLAEHSGRSETFPFFFKYKVEIEFSEVPAEQFNVDYLVNLFLELRKKEGDNWKLLKKEVVRKLKWYDQQQPSKIKETIPFAEMFERDYEAGMEFSGIYMMEVGHVSYNQVSRTFPMFCELNMDRIGQGVL